ncbi:translation initiation factor Sui1 [Desulfosarcina ovata]|nr:translation initiation factor Sui1 [Desulfosarcina ovata]
MQEQKIFRPCTAHATGTKNEWDETIMTRNHQRDTRLVYSTEHGGTCPQCNQKLDRCRCRKAPARPAGDGIVRVSRATKGRKGKGVSVITGIPADDSELKQVAKVLKQKCGSGGTVKAGTIEIQGDHRDLLVAELKGMGYTVKRSGG